MTNNPAGNHTITPACVWMTGDKARDTGGARDHARVCVDDRQLRLSFPVM